MAVTGRQAVAVIDLHEAAVAARPARRDDFSIRGGAHRIAGSGAEIQAGMHRGPADEWVAAHAEARRELDLADHRLAIGHKRQRAIEAIDLGAGDVDAIKLALEGPGVRPELHRDEGAAHPRTWRGGFQLRHVEA